MKHKKVKKCKCKYCNKAFKDTSDADWTGLGNKSFRLGTAKKETRCNDCERIIHKGEPCISNISYWSTNSIRLCLCCIMGFILKSVPNAKGLIKEIKTWLVAREL